MPQSSPSRSSRIPRLSTLAIVACIVTAPACGVPLPAPQTFYKPITSTDPGYTELGLRQAAMDQLSVSPTQRTEGKALLTTQASLIKSLNGFAAFVSGANTTNQTYSSAYSWTNGVVGGLGAALAAVDSKRNWGPVAGGVGAVWNVLGLTLQKAFVDPRLSAGTSQLKDIVAVKAKYDAASDAWQALVSASSADAPAKWQAWAAAVGAANAQGQAVLGIVQRSR